MLLSYSHYGSLLPSTIITVMDAEEDARRRSIASVDTLQQQQQQRSISISHLNDKLEIYTPEPEDEDEDDDASENELVFAPSQNSFMDLNLSRPLLLACQRLGFNKPSPLQAACLPLAMAGRDICGIAITGSGKTAASALLTLERLLIRPKPEQVPGIRVLVLTPTRERGLQVLSMMEELAQFTDISCCQADGELSSKVQEAALRSKPVIVVATPESVTDHLPDSMSLDFTASPESITDHLPDSMSLDFTASPESITDQLPNSMSVDFKDLDVLILDEADRLLEVGFSPKIRKLVCLGPKRRQTMVFSATMTTELDELVEMSLTNPVRLSADPSAIRPATLTEEVVRIHRMHEVNQEAVLLALCSKTFTSKVIIFSGTKVAAHRLYIIFGLVGLKAAELHANILQGERLHALELFRKQEVDFLIATELLVRGIDMPVAEAVINYDCPSQLTSYVHRVSRTARAGREGHAVTFVTDNDRSCLKAIAKRIGSKLKSRTVAQKSISKWSQIIEQMEDKVTRILQEERDEQALRKARIEATKVQEQRSSIFV